MRWAYTYAGFAYPSDMTRARGEGLSEDGELVFRTTGGRYPLFAKRRLHDEQMKKYRVTITVEEIAEGATGKQTDSDGGE